MKNKTIIIFILLLITYYVVNLLTSESISGMSGRIQAQHNIYNQLMMGSIIVFMALKTFWGKLRFKTNTGKIAVVLLFFVLLRELVVFFYNDTLVLSNLNPFFSVVFWLLGFVFCINHFSEIDEKRINPYLTGLIVVYLGFVTYRTITQKDILRDAEILGGINVAGSVYMIVPLIMLVVKDKLKLFFYGYCLLLAIYSAKREAVAGMVIVSFFVFYDYLLSFFRKNFLRHFVILFVIVGTVYVNKSFIYNLASDLRARSSYYEETGSELDSGRKVLREAALVGFENAPLSIQLFGGGAGQCRIYIYDTISNPRFPHNGWVELMCDYGYLGVFLFGGFFLSIFLASRKMPGRENRLICYSVLSSWLLSFYVFHASNLQLIYFAITIGYLFNRAKVST